VENDLNPALASYLTQIQVPGIHSPYPPPAGFDRLFFRWMLLTDRATVAQLRTSYTAQHGTGPELLPTTPCPSSADSEWFQSRATRWGLLIAASGLAQVVPPVEPYGEGFRVLMAILLFLIAIVLFVFDPGSRRRGASLALQPLPHRARGLVATGTSHAHLSDPGSVQGPVIAGTRKEEDQCLHVGRS